MAMSNGSEPGVTARVSRKRVLRGPGALVFSYTIFHDSPLP